MLSTSSRVYAPRVPSRGTHCVDRTARATAGLQGRGAARRGGEGREGQVREVGCVGEGGWTRQAGVTNQRNELPGSTS